MASPTGRRPRALASVAVLVTLVVGFVGMTAGPAVAAHSISSFFPTTGSVGCAFEIIGTNFQTPVATTNVTVNGVNATHTVDSNTHITATIPSTTSGTVAVVAGDTQTTATSLTISGSGTCPTVTTLSPTSGTAGSTVTITGTNFTAASSVRFGTISATSTFVNSTQITATVPSGATGAVPVRVATAAGENYTAPSFTVTTAPAPTITSFSPAYGPVGRTVTITGTNFSGTGVTVNSVKFNGVTATYTVNSATQITATVPTGATTGKITVTTTGGTATSTNNFTVSTLHARSISLELHKHLVASGHVSASDGFSTCEANVPVKIQRWRPGGGWHTVRSTTTTSSGAYHAQLSDVAGSYRARAPKDVLSAGVDICQPAKSATRRHR